eukprot:TRINITY_DN17714_c0_g1::TRINITY_DN17714_c0_g1_i1::g.11376::m.11376 TRINITY_DN17714_c0_g1::TRINITY_DN17714_c0_g1_i1::g.11376  ORF type:complete len:173 (-),score=40.96 TRINITY_DN17714_c0_g1_i1:123-641(-)
MFGAIHIWNPLSLVPFAAAVIPAGTSGVNNGFFLPSFEVPFIPSLWVPNDDADALDNVDDEEEEADAGDEDEGCRERNGIGATGVNNDDDVAESCAEDPEAGRAIGGDDVDADVDVNADAVVDVEDVVVDVNADVAADNDVDVDADEDSPAGEGDRIQFRVMLPELLWLLME